jgi:hypothetical protein
MTPVVGFCGRAGAGKSTAAAALVEAGFVRVKFAGALKVMMRAFYLAAGLSIDEIERRIEGDLKEEPDELLGGRTPRFAMQTIGTEWGREIVSPDLWLRAWRGRVESVLRAGGRVVVDDLRFANEAEAVRRLGGRVVEITGREKAVEAHASESRDFAPDMTISNTGTEAELRGAALYIFGSDET